MIFLIALALSDPEDVRLTLHKYKGTHIPLKFAEKQASARLVAKKVGWSERLWSLFTPNTSRMAVDEKDYIEMQKQHHEHFLKLFESHQKMNLELQKEYKEKELAAQSQHNEEKKMHEMTVSALTISLKSIFINFLFILISKLFKFIAYNLENMALAQQQLISSPNQ